MSIGLTLLILFAVMLFVMFSGAPVFSSLGIAGIFGIVAWLGINQLQHAGMIAYTQGTNFNQIIAPMFIMMSESLSQGRIAEDIYSVLNRAVGKFRGGLAISTTLACTIFAALCGSSPATAASIGRISISEMTKRGYAPSFAVGTVAAAGTLGIMIPPSITFCFFGILTETSIVQLLMAGILPGIVLALMIVGFIIIRVRINPKLLNWIEEPENGPKSVSEIDSAAAKEIAGAAVMLAEKEASAGSVNGSSAVVAMPKKKEASFLTILPALVLIFVVLGSMYFGFATPMEGAGYGVIGAFIITLAQRRLTWKSFKSVFSNTARTGCMMIFLIMCGFILTYCVTYLGIAQSISDLIANSGLNRYVVLLLLYVLWFVLGCLMDPSSVVVLTVPFVFRALVDLDFNPLWIGVMTVLASQIGMITPPIGMNLFVLKANTDVEMKDIITGSIPYVVLLVVAMALFTIFPGIATVLPSLMFSK